MTMMMTTAPVADSKVEAMAVNSVRMTAEFEARLVAAAGQLRMSKSDVIRQALGEFLRKLEAVSPAQELAREFECAPGPLVMGRAD